MTEELAKVYEPKEVEDHWYKSWIESDCFKADPTSKKDPYCIVIPPPNVTGILTMGHVLNNTLQDILCRRKRMQGFEVLWLPGTDHAGIATQTVVERTLKKEGVIKHRDDLGRDKFVEKIWDWKHKHGSIIIQQLKKLGCSCDWSREVFTMDGLDPSNPNPAIDYPACVRKVFVDLYNKKLIYRGVRMVNWCPVSRTALSDEEVEMKEVDSQLWHLRYPLLNETTGEVSHEHLVVATTRPETMLGDEAVAVNPKDERYKNLVGRKILLPLQGKHIPIIADELVEMEFGTGAVKVTPAHDPADYDMGVRHNLPMTQVIGLDGVMTAEAGEKFDGLDRFECREAVVIDMKDLGLLEKTEPYKHNVGYSQRADVPVEPMLSKQWFLKYPSVKKSSKAVAKGEVKFWPERWAKVYSHWMENIRDWCISRQLWWGHRIPAWYCIKGVNDTSDASQTTLHERRFTNDKNKTCPPIVSVKAPEKCPTCGGTNLKQDPDVLDTWFSSWLWPFATMGWPEKTPELKKFYPTSDLVTGPDIIFFWVARMIMAGYEFMDKRPFDNVYFTGIIRDSKGRKMSKSLGNSPDPLDLIAKYGADSLRFGLMLIAPKGQDILFTEDRIEVGRNFMNKLWNASRFVMMNVTPHPDPLPRGERGENSPIPRGEGKKHSPLPRGEGKKYSPLPIGEGLGEGELSLADKWILNRLQHVTREVGDALDKYQFDTAAQALYQFVWGNYCDWYLEMSKTQLGSGDDEIAAVTRSTLLHVLEQITVLLHPFAPFITEEVWQKLKTLCHCEPKDERKTLHTSRFTIQYSDYPTPPKKTAYEDEAKEMNIIMEVIRTIRNIRGEHSIKPSKEIDTLLIAHNEEVVSVIENNKDYILSLAKVSNLTIECGTKPPDDGATAVAGPVEIFVPFAGLIDISAEKGRLSKEIDKVQSNTDRLEKKLSNKQFVDKAPKEIVKKEEAKLAEGKKELEKLTNALRKLD